jgi:hypothetical protein
MKMKKMMDEKELKASKRLGNKKMVRNAKRKSGRR